MSASQSDHVSQSGEQRYRHLFEHAPICIFVVDLSRNPAIIVEANRRAELVFGYTDAAMAGMPVDQILPPESIPVVSATVERVQKGAWFKSGQSHLYKWHRVAGVLRRRTLR